MLQRTGGHGLSQIRSSNLSDIKRYDGFYDSDPIQPVEGWTPKIYLVRETSLCIRKCFLVQVDSKFEILLKGFFGVHLAITMKPQFHLQFSRRHFGMYDPQYE